MKELEQIFQGIRNFEDKYQNKYRAEFTDKLANGARSYMIYKNGNDDDAYRLVGTLVCKGKLNSKKLLDWLLEN